MNLDRKDLDPRSKFIILKAIEVGETLVPLAVSIEDEILKNPEVGDLVPGVGGIRKMRVADPERSKGKSGGYRVLYLDVPHQKKTHLLYFYGKDEAENITAQEKRYFKELAHMIKGENHG